MFIKQLKMMDPVSTPWISKSKLFSFVFSHSLFTNMSLVLHRGEESFTLTDRILLLKIILYYVILFNHNLNVTIQIKIVQNSAKTVKICFKIHRSFLYFHNYLTYARWRNNALLPVEMGQLARQLFTHRNAVFYLWTTPGFGKGSIMLALQSFQGRKL